jgi:acetyl esterase/lipase
MNTFPGRPKLFAVEQLRDQVYSRAGGKRRLADLYLPSPPDGKAPVIVWVHGGGWRFGDRHLAPDLSRFIAERGFAMVSFDYRLSDEAAFPAPIEDMKTVVRWVRSVAGQYNLDGEHIGLWGSSAGAHLAACAALSDDSQFVSEEYAEFSSQVQAVLDGYGPTDFSRIDADRIPADSQRVDVESVSVPNLLAASHPESFESRFLGVSVGSSPREVSLASPISYAHPGAPPFLMLHGRYDPLMPWQQSLLLFEALESTDNEVTLLVLERLGHGFFNNSKLDFVDPGAITVYQSPPASRSAFGGRIRHLPFGFDLVEEFFRSSLLVTSSKSRDTVGWREFAK